MTKRILTLVCAVALIGAVAYLTPVQKAPTKDGVSYSQVQTDDNETVFPQPKAAATMQPQVVEPYQGPKVARGWCVEMVESPNDTELANYLRATVATLD